VANDPAVLAASPVLELDSYARRPPADTTLGSATAPAPAASMTSLRASNRHALRLLGLDALQVAPLALNLLPRAADGQDRLAFLAPDKLFLNPAARQVLGVQPGQTLQVQQGSRWLNFTVAGDVAVGGAPLAVLDIAAAQALFGATGQISRLDLRLAPGAQAGALLPRWNLPPGVRAVAPDEAEQKLSTLSRAYRVNLTVLAGVALFVGAFLVFSVVALSVAQRTPALALLGVLGLTAQERRGLVLWECGLLGAAGSVLGLLGGWGMAVAALRLLAGDLGGGYFPGITPTVQWSGGGALLFGALGVLSALVGGWWPALAAQRLAPAQALKGLGLVDHRAPPAWPGLALLAAGAGLAFVPPLFGLPLAA
jgi:putative ABC transport system permease protein